MKIKRTIFSIVASALVASFTLASVASAENLNAIKAESARIETKVETEEFTIYSYCPDTGVEEFIECDTSFVADQINNGATHVTTPSYLGEEMAEQGSLGEEVSPNIIIGGDTRYKITDTTKAPYRSICLVETVWKDGSISHGTGCLIGPDIVLTSAHMVYNPSYGGNVKFVNVYPGLNGGNLVYGQLVAKSIYITDEWRTSRPIKDDWALMKLQDLNGNPTTVGNVTGYLGLDYISTESLNGISVYVTGYPGDKAVGTSYTMWRAGGAITTTTSTTLYYDCDVVAGFSGAPVTNSSHKIVGIHKGEGYNSSVGSTQNLGVRVTSTLMSTINSLPGNLGW